MTRQHRNLFLGKWFNYGLLVLVLILDLNMWKNQILYKPEYYGQYTGKKNSVLIDMKYMHNEKYFDSFVVIICNLSILQQSTTECLQ